MNLQRSIKHWGRTKYLCRGVSSKHIEDTVYARCFMQVEFYVHHAGLQITPETSQDESKRGEPGPCYELCQDLRHVPTRIAGITWENRLPGADLFVLSGYLAAFM